jgi:hypothetical protein
VLINSGLDINASIARREGESAVDRRGRLDQGRAVTFGGHKQFLTLGPHSNSRVFDEQQTPTVVVRKRRFGAAV